MQHRQTKIICTIGPATESKESLIKLIESGMNIARLNFSHGDHQSHLSKINLIKEIENETGSNIGIMLDTKGPEIRVRDIINGGIQINVDDEVEITTNNIIGTNKIFSVTYENFVKEVNIKDTIFIDDGLLHLKVIGKNSEVIQCKALNSHFLKSKKGVNVPSCRLNMNYLSKQDIDDIKFGCKHNIDYIAASFVRNVDDLINIRNLLKELGADHVKLISKIENNEAISNLDEIIKNSDAIMVARGDLGVEIPEEQVPYYQGDIVAKCRKNGIPVIIATQMLDSMQENPRPTRAEVSDVALAVSEGCDAIMLSGETASGKFPFEAVKMQNKIALQTEKNLPYQQFIKESYDYSDKTTNDAIALAIASSSYLIGAKLIISFTTKGDSAKRISKARPHCPIIAITNCEKTSANLNLWWGVNSILLSQPLPNKFEDLEIIALQVASNYNLVKGDEIILAGGIPSGEGKTNLMKIITLK